jgi:hypothetical protein
LLVSFNLLGYQIQQKRLLCNQRPKTSGSGWIRTADQGLMSPLLYH